MDRRVYISEMDTAEKGDYTTNGQFYTFNH